jgi:lysophospholipase L1-like esterase
MTLRTLFQTARSFTTLAAAACLALIPARISAADPPKPGPFEKDIRAFEATDKTNPPPANAILLVGDSQFTKWKAVHDDLPEYLIINRGFGGSKMSDLLLYTDRIVLPYKPRMIVVNEGGNDVHYNRTPEQLLGDITNFVAQVRAVLPDTPIVIDGLAPSPVRSSESDTRLRFNAMLKPWLAAGKNLIYLDMFNSYLGADGKPDEKLFLEDKLHNNPAGYAVRARLMRQVLGKPDFPERKPAR